MKFPTLVKMAVLSFLVACGSKDIELANDADPGEVVDAAPGTSADADPDDMSSECVPGAAQCSNCVDDDLDGFIDGADPECTGFNDNDESSFETGIPGDNVDATIQDCFFDGDSGGGNDGCDQHVCCMLAGTSTPCCEGDQTPEADNCFAYTGPPYNPNDCGLSQTCIDNCGPLTPPGCDCFGCCTVCNGDECVDVLTNPVVYEEPNCEGNADPAQGECCESEKLGGCYTCTKSTECEGGTCDSDPTDCILCPGQSEDDLPASCEGDQACPAGQSECTQTADCGQDQYCSNGCCVSSIIVD